MEKKCLGKEIRHELIWKDFKEKKEILNSVLGQDLKLEIFECHFKIRCY